MYPGRRDKIRHGGPTYSGGVDFLERYGIILISFSLLWFHKFQFQSRHIQRQARTVYIWPASPKSTTTELYVDFF